MFFYDFSEYFGICVDIMSPLRKPFKEAHLGPLHRFI